MALLASALYTICDMTDPVVSDTAPSSPTTDLLWMDTGSSPQQLKRWDGTAWVATGADPDTYFTKTETTSKLSLLDDKIKSTVTSIETVQDALNNKADIATIEELSTQLSQTATDLVAVISRTTSLEGGQDATDELLATYQLTFRIDASGVTIGKSDSDFDMHMDNTQLQFRQSGNVIAYISNNKLYIASAEVTSDLKIGSYIWRSMKDGSLGLLYKS